jgi:peptide chain release factor 1
MLDDQLKKLQERYATINDILNTTNDHKEIAKLSKEYKELGEFIPIINDFLNSKSQLSELDHLIAREEDTDMKNLMQEEYAELKKKITTLEYDIKIMLLPKDIDDERDAILEIRAGTGGDEAGLFAADLFRMYQRYSAHQGWTFEILDFQDSGLGSIKEAVASIKGKDVFSRLKFESGVHRVQRVPVTEAGGRIHTSTATVAVLPEVEDVDIHIEEKDLRIDVYRASGAGGQHVNKTESAIRITHIPTGIVVTQQDDRSQHKNKAKALKILQAKLYQVEKDKVVSEQAEQRKSQVGTAERSERIRTYNFPQGRVSDHRINLTLYKISQILEGEALDELIDSLIADDQLKKLASIGE